MKRGHNHVTNASDDIETSNRIYQLKADYRKKRRTYVFRPIDFQQEFFSVNLLEKELFTVYRFKVFSYIPVKQSANIEYYLLNNSWYEDLMCETALFGICWFRFPNRDEKELWYSYRMLVTGDRELWQYVCRILLEKLINAKQEELRKQGRGWVIKPIEYRTN